MTPLRILIADDHSLVRQGLRAVLAAQSGWSVCGEATNGREAVRMAEELKPDVAVLDVSMPELNGLDAARQIRKQVPETSVLILTMHESDQLAAEVLQAGAHGCVLKSDSARLLVAAVESVAERKPFFTGKVAAMMLEGRVRPQDGAVSRLTPREREIVQLLAEGLTNKEAAAKLGISAKTVDAHRTNIMRRLNLHSFAEMVRYAIRENIVAL
jgi:DNA-binding NarL/FixJ family response regulator